MSARARRARAASDRGLIRKVARDALATNVGHRREEQCELEARATRSARNLPSANDDRLHVHRLGGRVRGQEEPHGQAGHLLVVAARRALQPAERQIVRDHAGDRAAVAGQTFDLELAGKTSVGAAFDGGAAHGKPSEVPWNGELSYQRPPAPKRVRKARALEADVDREELKRLLEEVSKGRIGVEAAALRLRHLPQATLGFATVDTHRAIRRGFPETVYGEGKSVAQIVKIVGGLASAGQEALVTRVGPEVGRAVRAKFPRAKYHAEARTIVLRARKVVPARPGVVVLTAGTTDIAVAEEAALTAEVMGEEVRRIFD